jgi:glycosyltransferase involved in cell wall biosynthesis
MSQRILMISPQFRPLVGGYELAAERLSGALVEAGLNVVVVAERRDRAWPAAERVDGYDIRRLSCCYRRRLHTVTSLLSYAGFLLSDGRDFDVWHVHQYGVHAALAVALGKILRRPVVLKLTSSGPMGIATTLGSNNVGRVLGYFHRRVSACLSLTEETRAEAMGFGIPAERIHLMPNGVDGRRFHPASPDERASARRALGLECERVVLCVGRLSAEKNSIGLLDAWAAVDAKARQGTLLVLVGDGPDRVRVQSRAHAPDLRNQVVLAGHQSDVAAWYRAADLYVLSSHNEGLSNSMVEALASGLPVASTRVSGSSVLVESAAAGIVVDRNDVDSLARVIEELLADESKRTRLGRNARRVFETRFSLETVARKMILLYQALQHPTHKGGAA